MLGWGARSHSTLPCGAGPCYTEAQALSLSGKGQVIGCKGWPGIGPEEAATGAVPMGRVGLGMERGTEGKVKCHIL